MRREPLVALVLSGLMSRATVPATRVVAGTTRVSLPYREIRAQDGTGVPHSYSRHFLARVGGFLTRLRLMRTHLFFQRVQILFRNRLVGINLQGVFEVRPRVVKASHLRQRRSQICLGVRIFRLQLQRELELP